MNYESFLELAKKRRSYWEFNSNPVPDDYIEKIVDAARWAPSGFNSQPWEFVVIKEQALKDRIVDIIGGAGPSRPVKDSPPPAPKPGMKDPMGFKTAPVFIILFGDPRVRNYGPPGLQDNDKKWLETFVSSLAIPFQYMHMAATSLGLASKWVSGAAFPDAEHKIKGLLGVPDEFVVYDMMALGYSDFEPKPKKMRELKEVLHYDMCGEGEFRTEAQIKEYFPKR
jgi:nitroreductase